MNRVLGFLTQNRVVFVRLLTAFCRMLAHRAEAVRRFLVSKAIRQCGRCLLINRLWVECGGCWFYFEITFYWKVNPSIQRSDLRLGFRSWLFYKTTIVDWVWKSRRKRLFFRIKLCADRTKTRLSPSSAKQGGSGYFGKLSNKAIRKVNSASAIAKSCPEFTQIL